MPIMAFVLAPTAIPTLWTVVPTGIIMGTVMGFAVPDKVEKYYEEVKNYIIDNVAYMPIPALAALGIHAGNAFVYNAYKGSLDGLDEALSCSEELVLELIYPILQFTYTKCLCMNPNDDTSEMFDYILKKSAPVVLAIYGSLVGGLGTGAYKALQLSGDSATTEDNIDL